MPTRSSRSRTAWQRTQYIRGGAPFSDRRILGGSAALPSDYNGLLGWYDLGDITTLWQDAARTSAVTADAQTILGITDKSGNLNHLSQATGSKGFTYKAAIQNGRSVGRVDGVDDYLATSGGFFYGGAGGPADLTPYTGYLICKRNGAPTGYSGLWQIGMTSYTVSGAQYNQIYAPSGGTIRDNFDTAGLQIDTGTSFGTSAVVISFDYDGTNSHVWLNGVLKGTGTGAQVVTNSGLILGSWNGNVANADVMESFLYLGAQPSADRVELESYAISKWGVS